jgi:uncharacterized metal-binding protein YceD (DUF177 family)
MTGFDLPPTPTYHTRLMLGGWSKPREVAKLADTRAEFEFAIPVGELPGIPAEWSLSGEPVQVVLRFAREQGAACQRCLAPMNLEVSSSSRVAVIETAAAADTVPGEMETFLAPDGRCDLAALAAEELLLALPIVPRHAEGERCAAAPTAAANALDSDAGAAQPPVVQHDTQRPFADLRALLERAKS